LQIALAQCMIFFLAMLALFERSEPADLFSALWTLPTTNRSSPARCFWRL